VTFLKQFVNEKNMKLLVYPKKVNDFHSEPIDSDHPLPKLTRVVSADKNMLIKL
jgi:hypothetical protein